MSGVGTMVVAVIVAGVGIGVLCRVSFLFLLIAPSQVGHHLLLHIYLGMRQGRPHLTESERHIR